MFNAIILAAEEGQKMNSAKPGFLHEVSFQPLVKWVVDATADAKKQIVIVSSCKEEVKEFLGNSVDYVKQSGTEQAFIRALKVIENIDDDILVVLGNAPLITRETIMSAYEFHKKSGSSVTVLTSSTICFIKAKDLLFALDIIKNNKSCKEYCFTDIIEILDNKGFKTDSFVVNDASEVMVVNDRLQLAEAQRIMQNRIVKSHMLNGVTFISPETAFVGKNVKIGNDTVIMPNTIIKGNTTIGTNCLIGPNTQITDCEVLNDVEINSSVLIESSVDSNTKIGPFAYIRPHCKIGKNIKIGDFVEIKNATIDDGTKVSHLTYVGDADVGKNVNFGCGTVLVNYDGANKHRSTIEDNAFIGCNTNLVSPVNVKQSAFIAAGSTITDDVPENSLAIARARQVVKTDWKRKTNK